MPFDRSRPLCTSLSLQEVRRLPPMPSGFSTQAVYRLEHTERPGEYLWRLSEHPLPHVLTKTYDDGRADEWLEANADAGQASDMSFLGVEIDGAIRGLATWRSQEWNNTAWLVDIRVAASSRRKGVGSRLMDCLEERAVSLGLRGITLETQTTNYPAVRFYLKHGFAIAGFHEYLYSNRDVERGDVALYLYRALD